MSRLPGEERGAQPPVKQSQESNQQIESLAGPGFSHQGVRERVKYKGLKVDGCKSKLEGRGPNAVLRVEG